MLPGYLIGAPKSGVRPVPRRELAQLRLNVYYNRLEPSGYLSTDPAEAGRLYALATAELGPTLACDQALYTFFEYHLMRSLPGVEAAYPTFRAQNRDSTLARQLRQRLAGQQLAPGQLVPDFTLRDTTGREVSLHDLRGKVVYLADGVPGARSA